MVNLSSIISASYHSGTISDVTQPIPHAVILLMISRFHNILPRIIIEFTRTKQSKFAMANKRDHKGGHMNARPGYISFKRDSVYHSYDKILFIR